MSLRGVRVAVTRPADQAADLARALDAAGARVLAIPLIRVAPAADPAPLDAALRRLDTYDWIVFTSANAVRFTIEGLQRTGIPADRLARARLACVGPATAAAVRAAGAEPDAMPADFVGAAVTDAMTRVGPLAGRRVLWPRAEAARPTVTDALRAAGARVDDPVAYRTIADADGASRLARIVLQKGVDVVTFASPSAVRALADALDARGDVQIATIGPVTAAAARRAGFRVEIVSEEHTAAGLVAALRDRYRDTGEGQQEGS